MSIGIAWGNVERIGPGLYRLDFNASLFSIRAVTGIEKLVYEVLYTMLTTLGAIAGAPDVGCFIPSFIGRLAAAPGSSLDKAREAIAFEVIRIQDQIRERQASLDIPDEERLKSVTLDEITIDPNTRSAELKIAIINAKDQAAMVSVPQIIAS